MNKLVYCIRCDRAGKASEMLPLPDEEGGPTFYLHLHCRNAHLDAVTEFQMLTLLDAAEDARAKDVLDQFLRRRRRKGGIA